MELPARTSLCQNQGMSLAGPGRSTSAWQAGSLGPKGLEGGVVWHSKWTGCMGAE